MSSGNYMVDEQDRIEDRSSRVCRACSGNGFVKWTDMEKFSEEVAYICYKEAKAKRPVKDFRSLIAIARGVKRAGMECPECLGDGRVWL